MKKRIVLSVFVSVFLSAMFGAPFAVTAAKYGGATLIMGTTDSVESAIDPAQAWDFFGWEIIQNTGCGLVETEPGTGDILPCLALNWDVSGDGLIWNFTLKQGVKFDDGTEFNATHVKYSFDRSMGIASPDGPQVGLEYDAIIKNVTVISKYVVQFNLKIPFAPFLGLMACPASFIVNPKYAPFDQVVYYTEGDARASTPMDLGPYKLTKWTRVAGKDKEMLLEANPNYWRSGYPKTEKILIKFYANATALRLAIEGGDIDIAFRHITAADIEDLKDDPDLKVWEGARAQIQFLVFQEDPVTGLPQLNDARIRRAIAAALNRSEVCETVFLNQASPLYSIIPAGMLGHTEAFAALGDANYTLTQILLAELGYNAANKLQIELWYETSGHYPSSEDQATLYKEQLEGSGVISVTLKSADWPSYRINRNTGVMHVFIYGWYPDYIDPDNYCFLYWAGWINHHYAKYNATNLYFNMTAAYDAARATTNETLREELYAELEDYAVRDCPMVPIWQGKAYAVTKPYVQGVYLDVTESWRMWYLYSTRGSSTISIGLSSASIIFGSNVTISGSIDPVGENVTVTIRYRQNGVVDWTTLATVKTDTNSYYSYTWTPDAVGTYEVMASWAGDMDTEGGESDVKTLTVEGIRGVYEVVWKGEVFYVIIESNSIVSDFAFNQSGRQISFNVTGAAGTPSFCNVTIPIRLLDGAFMVLIDNANTFYMLTLNETHIFLYFSYSHSAHNIKIIGTTVIPEFPSATILSLFIVATLVTVILGKTIQSRSTCKRNRKRKRDPFPPYFF